MKKQNSQIIERLIYEMELRNYSPSEVKTKESQEKMGNKEKTIKKSIKNHQYFHQKIIKNSKNTHSIFEA